MDTAWRGASESKCADPCGTLQHEDGRQIITKWNQERGRDEGVAESPSNLKPDLPHPKDQPPRHDSRTSALLYTLQAEKVRALPAYSPPARFSFSPQG